MGVPKFFRYISERYPCLSELAREQSIPDFDNLYLDMNGIIHNCSHPDDANIHFKITEENMFKDIFNYIDKLFFLIKPSKIFFMAVDGVAPRAKMNQQRSRRFRSAKDAEILTAQALKRGESIDSEPFDSNCITPGTEFMSRLHEALRYFIKSKISSDPMWQKCRIILSGHDCPGEGEHKIMDYIRYLKSQKDYNPNTQHCLYGLDADLIILGLCTHELHFVVLREEVKFGRKTKRASVEETRFFLLHLGLLREYLELEFDELRQNNPSFDIAKLIDDWVLMGFLVGNDFIPHLPCLHISSNALPLLYKTYIKVYPTLQGNINECGKLNLQRLETYFAALSEVEFEIFQENHADLKYFEAKQSNNGVDEAFDFDVNEISNESTDKDLATLIESSRQLFGDDFDSSDEEQHIGEEFENYKRNYYMKKLNQDDSSKAYKREQAIGYITALQWILDYYYRGVQSWGWYYPHHYAPFISDLKDFKDHKITFNLGKPFLPFEQLLGVLPAASKQLLPPAYQDLMTSSNSEIIHFYPKDFETDLNGKKNEWEAVVLIPFIDETLLLHAMKDCESKLTSSESMRNKHGPMLQYDYCDTSQGFVSGIYSMKSLYHVFCTETSIWASDIIVPADETVCVELPNAARSVFFPGFPTTKHLKYNFQLKFARVKVFDYPSRNENLILMPENRSGFDNIYTVAEKYLNQVVFVGWPHLIKAKVVGISNAQHYIDTDGIREMESKIFAMHVKTAQEHLQGRMGIEIDDFSVMVHVRTYIGSTYVCGNHGKISVGDVWAPTQTAYPAQAVVAEIAVHNAVQNRHKTVEDLFPLNSTIFFVGSPYFGSEGTVLDPLLVYECGRLKVNITVLPEPDFTEAKYIQKQSESDYLSAFEVAGRIGINANCLGRITGSLLVIRGGRRANLPENSPKLNIGLQLKYPKQQEERAGYARRIDAQWYYSTKAIELIELYYEKFPMVIEALSKSSSELFFETDFFPDGEEADSEGCIEKLVTWLKAQPHMEVEKIATGSKRLEKEAVAKVLESIEQLKCMPVKNVKLQVKPHLLLKPDVTLPNTYKAKGPVRLFDRVVIVRTTYMVPLGAKGTVVGIHPVTDPNTVRLECVKQVNHFFEVLFDKPLPNGNDIHGIANDRIYKVPESSILLIYNQDNKEKDVFNAKQNDHVNNNVANMPSTSINISNKNSSNVNNFYAKSKTLQSNKYSQNNDITTTPMTTTMTTTTTRTSSSPSSSSMNKGGADFWLPKRDTKKVGNTTIMNRFPTNRNVPENNKTYNAELKSSNPNYPIVDNSIVPPTMCNENEYKVETQALKNLLGITHPNGSMPAMTTTTADHHKQLPQPPSNWRTDRNDKSYTQNSNFQYAPNMLQSPVRLSCNSLPAPNAIPASLSPNHTAFFTPQMTTAALQSPKNSSLHNLDSRSITNKKSAFTPLQARRNYHQANTQQSPDTSTSHVDELQQNLNNIKLATPNVASSMHNIPNSTNTMAAHNILTKQKETRKKTPRIPKIGAKFDFNHRCNFYDQTT